MIAFGGLSWALDGAAAPVGGGAAPRGGDGARRVRWSRGTGRPTGMPAREIRFRNVTFAYPTADEPGAREASISRSPPARRWPSSARTAPARRRSPSCSAGSTTRRSGAIEVDGVDLRDARPRRLAVAADGRVSGLHPLRAAAARQRGAGRCARTTMIRAALAEAGAAGLADLDTVLARGYAGGTDLSGGQWQRVALARALCAVRAGRGRGAARRAHRAARRARRGRDLRPHPRRHAARHHDPDLAPVLDRAPRRSHLRARARAGWSSSARTTS